MLEQRLRAARILWGALLASVGMYALVLVMAKRPVLDQVPNPMLLPVFGFVALVVATMSFVLPGIALKQGLPRLNLPLAEAPDPNAPGAFKTTRKTFRDPEQAMLAAFPIWQTGMIMGCALSEAVALFGFVLGWLGHGLPVAAPFLCAGAVLIAVRFPRPLVIRRALESAYGVSF